MPSALAANWDIADTRQPYRDLSFVTTEGTWMSVDVSPDGRTTVFDPAGRIEQGESVKSVSSKGGSPGLELRQDLVAQHGTWFVVRARGQNPNVIAHSSPIYVVMDGQSFWKPSVVPAIVAKHKLAMQELLQPRCPEKVEVWETQEPTSNIGMPSNALLRSALLKPTLFMTIWRSAPRVRRSNRSPAW